jgi:hypothetical protein
MIVFDVCCDKGHVFEGWFKDSASFTRQAKKDLVECPTCGSTKVRKALMAPAVSGTKARKARQDKQEQKQVAVAAPHNAPAAMPAELMQELRTLRKKIEDNCDYVGPRFSEEARKMHYDEAEKRSIYGEATAEDAKALAEEGIEFGQIPWVPREDA